MTILADNPIKALNIRYTPDDLLMRPDSRDYERVGGQLVERTTGSESSLVAAAISSVQRNICVEGKLGWVFDSEAGCRCYPEDPDKVRRPDVSVVLRGRLPGEKIPKGWMEIPPDLAVEVLSPHDLATDVDVKVEEYLAVGVRRVWGVNPQTRTVRIHRPDGSATTLQESDELTGEDVIPAFRCLLSDIFPLPVALDGEEGNVTQ